MSLQKFLALFFLLLTSSVFCQNDTDENHTKIAAVLNNYFDLEREAIHLHLDKTSFMNNETIWYQGYIINRKTDKPFFTTNVFILFFDEHGKLVSEKLIYAANGVFSGKIDLNAKLESGNYYIQAYTNWMNNFSENESTITKVTVINPSEGIKNYTKAESKSLEIFLNPEGKSLVRDIPNAIGIQVKDCRGNSPSNLEAIIQKSNGEVLKKVKLNQFGLGRFDIIPTNETIKVIVNTENRILEKTLQLPNLVGISIEVNTFTLEDKTAIKIKTNQSGFDAFQSKKLNLVIHQDQKLNAYPFEFKANEFEKTLIINNSDLYNGINTIRIIDSDLKQWSERSIFINSNKKSSINIFKNNRNADKINLIAYSGTPNAILSISILPEDTKSIDENNSIVAGIKINPYLTEPLSNANYYLNSPSRLKLYELDLALLCEEKSKYNWENMKINVPTIKYSFDIGLTIKGKIDPAIKNKTYHKVKMVDYKDLIMMSADVSENGEYQLEHLIVSDSAYVKLSLEKLPNFEKITSLLNSQVTNRRKPFNKSIISHISKICADSLTYDAISDFDLPKFNGKIIKLDEVVIKKKEPQLTRQRALSNSMLRGFKIDPSTHHGTVLNFIEMNGFAVTRNMGDVFITIRQRTSINSANPTPLVYIDGRLLFSSYNELDFMQMSDVDEIYLDSHAIVASIKNNSGIIKIYTKKPQSGFSNKPDPNTFMVKEAFSLNYPFRNADYLETQSKGFDNYAVLGWTPLIKSDEKGDFKFDVMDYNKFRCKMIIEGITVDGEPFHEEKIVELK